MISAISQLAANAPQTGAATPNVGSSADIFLSLLTQEFQTSNGLVDPSLANLNTKQPVTNNAKTDKADPNLSDVGVSAPITASANNVAPKKVADKDKNQSAKTDETQATPTIQAPALPVVTNPVPVPQTNLPAEQNTASAGENNKVSETSSLAIYSPDTNKSQSISTQANFVDKKSAQPQIKTNVTPVQPENVEPADENAVEENIGAVAPSGNTPQANSAQADVKAVVGEVAKSSINTTIASPKRIVAPNKESQTTFTPDTNAKSASNATPAPAPTPDPGTTVNDPSAIAMNATVVATPAANQTIPADNKFTAQQTDDNTTTGVVAGVADSKSKDSIAAVKSAFRKDEGQLNQQDAQQGAIANSGPNSNDQQIAAAGNPAFHSAVAQQIHATDAASSSAQHSPVSTKTSSSNNLQSASQQITAAAAHDSTLPVASGPLQSAKLVERLGQSELRVGVQVGDMGGVDIRTSMAHNQLTAEISVEHSELGHMLAANLPSLQNKLSEHQIQTANITFQNQMSGNSSQSEQQKSRQGSSSQSPAPIQRIPFGEAESFTRMSASSSELVETNAGLDIHI